MILDRRHHRLIDGERSIRLRPACAALLEVLALAYPKPATHGALMDALWPSNRLEKEQADVARLETENGQLTTVILSLKTENAKLNAELSQAKRARNERGQDAQAS